MVQSRRKKLVSWLMVVLFISFASTQVMAETKAYESYGETGFYGKYEKKQSNPSGSTHLTEDEKNSLSSASPGGEVMIPVAGDSSNSSIYTMSAMTLLVSLIFFRKLSLHKKIA